MLRILAAGLAGALALAGPAAAQDRVVNIFNWSNYIDPEVLSDFTEETGIEVVYSVYDSNEFLEAVMFGGGSGYDVVVPTGPNLTRMIAAGVFQKLDKSKLPNLVHAWPEISQRLAIYDPGNEYAVNYMWGTTALGFDRPKLEERLPGDPLDSWDLLFDPEKASKLADCGIYLLDSPDDVIPAALNYLGLDPDSKEPADLERAAELVKAVRPYIEKFHSSEYIDALANGDICLALGFSGDIFQARDRAEEAGTGAEIEYIIPKEGALMWFDNLAIPADAPHPDEAHALIDFLLRPEIAARNSNFVFYANGNIDSQPLVDKEVFDDPAIYPDAETLAKLYTTTPFGPEAQSLLTTLWTDIKAGG